LKFFLTVGRAGAVARERLTKYREAVGKTDGRGAADGKGGAS